MFSEAEVLQTGLDHALVGHFHGNYLGQSHSYPGAPVSHEFIESAPGGAVLVEVDGAGDVRRELIETQAQPLHLVELDVSDIASEKKLEQTVKEAVSGLEGIVRVKLTGRLSHGSTVRVAALGKAVARAAQVLIDVDDLLPGVDAEAVADESSVRGQFVREVLASPRLSESQRDRILSIGLRALENESELEAIG